MRILIHHERVRRYYDVSTPSLRRGAYCFIFDRLGKCGKYDHPLGGNSEIEITLFNRATVGDYDALEKFLHLRSALGYPNEKIELSEGSDMGCEMEERRANRRMMEALRYLARKRCSKRNCGTACLCAPCSAREALAYFENQPRRDSDTRDGLPKRLQLR